MDTGKVSYKKIDSRCDVRLRELNRNKTARRLIAGARKKRVNAGLIVTSPEPFEAGALIEIDIKFPGQEATYRSRGIVDYVSRRAEGGAGVELAVAIFGIDKLDPNAPSPSVAPRAPTCEPKAPSLPPTHAATVRVSSPVVSAAAAPPAPMPEAAPPKVSEPPAPPKKPSIPPESTMKLKLPDPDDVGEILSGLVDGEIKAALDSGPPLATKRFAAVGEYTMDDGDIGYLMVADVKLINRLGSALVMLPKAESESAIENNRISEEMRESFQEILNIATGLMNSGGNPHSRFHKLYLPGKESLPDNVTAIINKPGTRADFQIEIPGYGQGRLCILDKFRS